MLEFGEKARGVQYKEIQCVRALIRNDKGQFIFVQLGDQYFLLGGGIEAGESPEQALHREAREEIGAKIIVGKKIGEAADYVYSRRVNDYFYKVNQFFEAKLDSEPQGGTEPDHKLVWAAVEEADKHVRQKSHIWAVKQIA